MTDTCGGCGDARHRLDLCAGCVQGLRDERDTARAEVERLTRDCADLSEMVSEVAAQRDEARAEVERLRPFEDALREAVREGVLFCSSFNHHRPSCIDCATVERLSAMVGLPPNPPMNPR